MKLTLVCATFLALGVSAVPTGHEAALNARSTNGSVPKHFHVGIPVTSKHNESEFNITEVLKNLAFKPDAMSAILSTPPFEEDDTVTIYKRETDLISWLGQYFNVTKLGSIVLEPPISLGTIKLPVALLTGSSRKRELYSADPTVPTPLLYGLGVPGIYYPSNSTGGHGDFILPIDTKVNVTDVLAQGGDGFKSLYDKATALNLTELAELSDSLGPVTADDIGAVSSAV